MVLGELYHPQPAYPSLDKLGPTRGRQTDEFVSIFHYFPPDQIFEKKEFVQETLRIVPPDVIFDISQKFNPVVAADFNGRLTSDLTDFYKNLYLVDQEFISQMVLDQASMSQNPLDYSRSVALAVAKPESEQLDYLVDIFKASGGRADLAGPVYKFVAIQPSEYGLEFIKYYLDDLIPLMKRNEPKDLKRDFAAIGRALSAVDSKDVEEFTANEIFQRWLDQIIASHFPVFKDKTPSKEIMTLLFKAEALRYRTKFDETSYQWITSVLDQPYLTAELLAANDLIFNPDIAAEITKRTNSSAIDTFMTFISKKSYETQLTYFTALRNYASRQIKVRFEGGKLIIRDAEPLQSVLATWPREEVLNLYLNVLVSLNPRSDSNYVFLQISPQDVLNKPELVSWIIMYHYWNKIHHFGNRTDILSLTTALAQIPADQIDKEPIKSQIRAGFNRGIEYSQKHGIRSQDFINQMVQFADKFGLNFDSQQYFQAFRD